MKYLWRAVPYEYGWEARTPAEVQIIEEHEVSRNAAKEEELLEEAQDRIVKADILLQFLQGHPARVAYRKALAQKKLKNGEQVSTLELNGLKGCTCDSRFICESERCNDNECDSPNVCIVDCDRCSPCILDVLQNGVAPEDMMPHCLHCGDEIEV